MSRAASASRGGFCRCDAPLSALRECGVTVPQTMPLRRVTTWEAVICPERPEVAPPVQFADVVQARRGRNLARRKKESS